jgi:hypothetical protein
MRISKYKYYISIAMFLTLTVFAPVQAIHEKKQDLVAMLAAVIGFFSIHC